MKRILLTLLTALFILPLLSASTAAGISAVPDKTVSALKDHGTAPVMEKRKTFKLGFFKRLLLKMYLRKMQKKHLVPGDHASADSKATTSLLLGIAAIIFLFIPTYTILLVIPLGIMAMVFGGQALREGTSKELAARLGKGFGLGALIALIVFFLIALIWISSWGIW